MYQILNLTTDPLQNMTLVLQDGSQLQLTIYYVPMQYGWFITSLTYGTFTLTGMRISNSPNMLYQYQNQIPFGLACFTTGNREPTQQLDFSTQTSILYILSQAECQQYAEYLSGINTT